MKSLLTAVPCAVFFCAATLLAISSVVAEETGWRTGPALRRQLEQPVGITWTGRSLRDALRSVSEEYRVATFLDRRVDPGTNVDLRVSDVRLEQALLLIASKQGLGTTWLGPVAYFGPAETARDLRTFSALREQDLQQLPREARGPLLRLRALEWPELATPRELLSDISRRYGVTVQNLDDVPHDLWPAVKLPPLKLVDQLVLIGAGFGFTFRIDSSGRKIQLVPAPSPVTIDEIYAADGVDPEKLAAVWSRIAPDALIKPFRGQVAVRGRIEDHELIEAARRGEPVRRSTVTKTPRVPTSREAKKVYKLKVSAPVGQLLRALAGQAGIDLRMDEKALTAAGVDLQQVVNVDVDDVTLDELLEAALRPAGLQHRREKTTVYVIPLGDPPGN